MRQLACSGPFSSLTLKKPQMGRWWVFLPGRHRRDSPCSHAVNVDDAAWAESEKNISGLALKWRHVGRSFTDWTMHSSASLTRKTDPVFCSSSINTKWKFNMSSEINDNVCPPDEHKLFLIWKTPQLFLISHQYILLFPRCCCKVTIDLVSINFTFALLFCFHRPSASVYQEISISVCFHVSIKDWMNE